MHVSIITISYNSEAEIAATIESVLAQSCLNETVSGDPVTMEYRIIDGGSTDRTVEIAERYRAAFEAKGVSYYILSEPDHGIYDAMNKGIRLADGDIIGLLNSGDRYEPETVRTMADTFRETGCDVAFGNIRICRTDGSGFVKKARKRRFQTSRDWNHPTMFVRAAVYKSHPFRCQGIHDDYGCYLELRKAGCRIVTVDKTLAEFHMGGASNRKSLKAACGRIRDRYRYCYRANGYSRLYLLECIVIEAAKLLLG